MSEPLRCKKCGGLWRDCYGCGKVRPGPEFQRLMDKRGAVEFAPRADVVRAPKPGHASARKPLLGIRCERCDNPIWTKNYEQRFCNTVCAAQATAARVRARRAGQAN